MTTEKAGSRERFVVLVQHGEAMPKDQDPERPLTEDGRKTVEKVAAWAAGTGLTVHRIHHSGKLRAEQTAGILSEKLQPKEGTSVLDRMGPKDDVAPIAEMLDDASEPVMLVGHLPYLSRLAGLLLAGNADRQVVQFHMGGIIGLVRTENGWAVTCAVPPDLVIV